MEGQHARNLRAVYFFGGGPRLEIELTVPSCPLLKEVRRWSGPKIDRAERMHDYMYFYLNANMDDHHHRVRIFRDGRFAVSPNLNTRGTFAPPEPIKKATVTLRKNHRPQGRGAFPGEMRITRNFARITFTVDADGIPRDFHVAETSDEAFARRVLATHEQITFKPALLNGEPTVVRASVRYLYYHYERGYRTTGYRSPYF